MPKQQERPCIGPVQIIEDQQHRCVGGQLAEPRSRCVEESQPFGVGCRLQWLRKALDDLGKLGTSRVSSSGADPRALVPPARPNRTRRASAKGW